MSDNPIEKEIVSVKVTNKNGKVVVDDVVKTNSKGKAKLDFNLKKGKYDVDVVYGGNDNFVGDNETQKLTIKEKEVAQLNLRHLHLPNHIQRFMPTAQTDLRCTVRRKSTSTCTTNTVL